MGHFVSLCIVVGKCRLFLGTFGVLYVSFGLLWVIAGCFPIISLVAVIYSYCARCGLSSDYF